MRRKLGTGALLALAFGSGAIPAVGCAKFAAEQTVNVAKQAAPALELENDYDLAEAATPGNLKFLEGLYAVIPDNAELLELLARGWSSYSFAFLEDRAQEAKALGDDKRQDYFTDRAINLYERGARYGMRLLGQKRGFDDAWKAGGNALEQKLLEFDRGEVGRLFWTGYSWVGAINLGQDRMENLTLLPKVIKLIERAAVLDGAYYFAGPHVILGGYNMALPKMLGGKPDKAKEHFDKAVELTQGKALLGKVLYAQLYAARTNNRALFTSLLEEVQNAPDDILPAAQLQTVIAKRKAKRLLKRIDEIF